MKREKDETLAVESVDGESVLRWMVDKRDDEDGERRGGEESTL